MKLGYDTLRQGGPRLTSLFTIGARDRRSGGGWWRGVGMQCAENLDVPLFPDCTTVLKLKGPLGRRDNPLKLVLLMFE